MKTEKIGPASVMSAMEKTLRFSYCQRTPANAAEQLSMVAVGFFATNDRNGELDLPSDRFGASCAKDRTWLMTAVQFEDWITRKPSLRP